MHPFPVRDGCCYRCYWSALQLYLGAQLPLHAVVGFKQPRSGAHLARAADTFLVGRVLQACRTLHTLQSAQVMGGHLLRFCKPVR